MAQALLATRALSECTLRQGMSVLVTLLAGALQHLGALEPLVFGLDFERFRSHFHLSGFFYY